MIRFGKGRTRLILPWMGVAVLSLIALKYLPVPYLWIFLSSSATLFFYAAINPARRAVWINAAIVFLTLAISEYYISTTGHHRFLAQRLDKGAVEHVFVPHKDLGWAPRPGSSLRHKRIFEDEILFDVNYSIEPNGLRISAPPIAALDPRNECILFFGGSFMFGQGLEDQQTLPFLIGKYSDHTYTTYNFGVMGYGAHQMLSGMEINLVRETIDCDPNLVTHIIYHAIPDHVQRASGCFILMGTRGPRYQLSSNGSAELSGYFEDYCPYYSHWEVLKNQIDKSYIINTVQRNKVFRQYAPESIDLYLAIIAQSRDIATSWYSEAQFHVLWWDEDTVDSQSVVDGLREKGIDVRLMSEILPSYEPHSLNSTYRQHRYDNHPNALAIDLIAQYVLREILH